MSYGGFEIKHEFRCPITLDVMRDPVMTVDGHTYERKAIEKWFNRGRVTSPLTGLDLAERTLVPNHALRATIEKHLKELEEAQKQKQKQAKITIYESFNPFVRIEAEAIVRTAHAIQKNKPDSEINWLDVHKVCQALLEERKGTAEEKRKNIFEVFCERHTLYEIENYYRDYSSDRDVQREILPKIYYFSARRYPQVVNSLVDTLESPYSELIVLDLSEVKLVSYSPIFMAVIKTIQLSYCGLKLINLSNSGIGEEEAKILAAALTNGDSLAPDLEFIDLSGCKISDVGKSALAQAVVSLKAKDRNIEINGIRNFDKFLKEANFDREQLASQIFERVTSKYGYSVYSQAEDVVKTVTAIGNKRYSYNLYWDEVEKVCANLIVGGSGFAAICSENFRREIGEIYNEFLAGDEQALKGIYYFDNNKCYMQFSKLLDILRSQHCEISSLKIGKNMLKAADVRDLARLLQTSRCKLSVLDISGNSLDYSSMLELVSALMSPHCKLTALVLGSMETNSVKITDSIKILAFALESPHSKLVHINLENNRISLQDAKHLAHAVARCRLNGRNVQITGINDFEKLVEEGTEQKAVGLVNWMEHVKREFSPFMYKRAQALVKTVYAVRKELDAKSDWQGVYKLCKNWTKAGAKSLYEGVSAITNTETTRDIAECYKKFIAGEAEGLKRIYHFTMDNYPQMNFDRLLEILNSPDCELLSLNLRGINFGENDIEKDDIEKLADLLKLPHCKLDSLIFEGNTLSDYNIIKLAEGFKSLHCKLSSLVIRNVKIGSAGMTALAKAIQSPHCKLNFIDFTDSDIAEEGVRNLVTAFIKYVENKKDIQIVGIKDFEKLLEATRNNVSGAGGVPVQTGRHSLSLG